MHPLSLAMRNHSMLRKLTLGCAFAIAFGVGALPAKPQATDALNASSMAVARDAVLPHVVSILVVRQDFAAGEARLSLSGGTGTIVSADGFIATNAHVTENGTRFRVVLNDQREYPAVLVGTDPISDLAVLKLQAPAGVRFGFATFANDLSALKPGDTILAMGAPWGMRDSVTAGVINHVSRLMVSLFEDEADYEQSLNATQSTARYYAWIQHDASISPGNSGGPLVDLSGRIIGVNTRGNMFGGDMAFSIPAPIAASVVQALIKEGKVTRSDFGFNVRSLRGTDLNEGVLISGVDRESLAEKAGLKPGDLLLSVDGKPITLAQPESVPDFRRSLAERTVGSVILLSVKRAQQTLAFAVASVPQVDQKPDEQEIAHWGISVGEITPDVVRTRYLDSAAGVLVAGLRTGGPAGTAQPPLQLGDRITHVNAKAVNAMRDFKIAAGSLPDVSENQAEPEAVTLSIDRAGNRLLVLLTPAPKRIIPPVNPELSKAWAGWEVQPIPGTLAKQLNLAQAGFRVTRLYPKGPAEVAGLQIGDLIVATGDNPVKPSGLKETSALDLRVRNALLTEPFAITILRAGKRQTQKLSLSEKPNPIETVDRLWNDELSTQLRALTFFDRIERKLKDSQKGVVVERVENGGYGGLAHLREGDLLVRLGDQDVSDLASFSKALAVAQASQVPKLSFLVMRGTGTRLLFVESPWKAK
jgi:S1-C subfamily serine protease